jgi:hypothetical protein
MTQVYCLTEKTKGQKSYDIVPLMGISIKNIYVLHVNCPTPPLQNYISLRGLSNKKINEKRKLKSQISS